MSAGSVGQINLDLGLNYSQFNNQVHGIAGNATNLIGGAFKKLGFIIAGALAVKSLVDFGRSSISLASNLNEVQNVVDVTFGSMASQVNQFSQGAITSLGMSELSAKRFASTIGAMFKSSGITGQGLTNMSIGVTKLAGDMASFYNINQADAFQKIQSGLAGEIMPLRQLGVSMTVANIQAFALSKGIKGNVSDMSQANQTLLRYQYLLSVTKDAQGDFARTSGSWANQTRVLSEQWNIFKTTMGQGLINVLTPLIGVINNIIAKLQVMAQYFKAFTTMLFGDAGAKANSASVATAGLGNSVDTTAGKVAKAGKKIKNSLAGFDQLNVLSKQAAASLAAAGDGAGALGDINLGGHAKTPDIKIDTKMFEPVKKVLNEIIDLAKQAGRFLADAFGPVISGAITLMMPVLNKWKTALGDTFSSIATLGKPIKDWFVNDLIPFWQLEIVALAKITEGFFDSALKVFTSIRDAVMPILNAFATQGLPFITDFCGDAVLAFMSLFDNVKSIFDTLWTEGVKPGLDLLSKMIADCIGIIYKFWKKWGSDITMDLIGTFNAIKGLFNTLWTVFLKPVWDRLLMELTTLWNKHFKGLITEVTNFIGILVTDALEILNKFIIPVVNDLVNTFGPAFRVVFKTVIGVVGTLLGVVADVAKGVIKILGGIVDFITGVLTGNWKKAFTGLFNIVKGIFDGVTGIVKGAVNVMIDGVNFLIDALDSIKVPSINLPGIGKIGGWGVNIKDIPHLANGGLISQPTLAMMGERGKKEAVVPLENSAFLKDFATTIAQAVALALASSGQVGGRSSDGPDTLILKIGETELGRIVIRAINNLQRQAGVTLLTR